MALIITTLGLNKAITANQQGLKVKITHVAIGTAGYVPNASMTTLQSEVSRKGISGGKDVAGNQIHLTAIFDDAFEITAREIGFFTEDGTLFAIDSSGPTSILIHKSKTAKLVQAFDLILDQVPPSSVTVDTSGALNMYYADIFATMATAQINNMRRSLINLTK